MVKQCLVLDSSTVAVALSSSSRRPGRWTRRISGPRLPWNCRAGAPGYRKLASRRPESSAAGADSRGGGVMGMSGTGCSVVMQTV